MAARRRNRRRVAARPPLVPELPGRNLGSAELRRTHGAGRAGVATALTSVSAIERQLASLRLDEERGARQRTSVMTHIAWVPEEWVEAAEDVLTGLAERHPSRTIVLFPQSRGHGLEGHVSVETFGTRVQRSVCTDTIRIRLRGTSAAHPA